ncbi:hypothetical protein BAE44_0024593 [Dichanthelium oligosanthes]|uniref:Uncharacterized protein n=1 Tax=Dichanthelium oligosanthes TaxID=888268 RepID=A0A1E5UNJ1_9POAL|nr:hypothetical protein BAE44_0024593 [Dichanthelium oligosanthes]
MDMAMEMNRCFAVVDIFAQLLRSNFNARFWRMTLTVLRAFKKKSLFMNDASHREQNLEVTKPSFDATKITEEFEYHDEYEIIGSVDGEAPMIPLQDVLFRGARRQGKFDVLGWKSHIPPYYSYAYNCEILRPQCMAITHWEEDNN